MKIRQKKQAQQPTCTSCCSKPKKWYKERLFIIGLSLIILLIMFIVLPDAARGEFIFLKDGKIIKGTIISDEAETIVARVNGKTRRIRRKTIMRILYTDLKMGKVYIQMRDGTSRIAYIVDEDRMSYICREELYSPKEFVLKRSAVLFVAEKNPSGLKGDSASDSIRLEWLPPLTVYALAGGCAAHGNISLIADPACAPCSFFPGAPFAC